MKGPAFLFAAVLFACVPLAAHADDGAFLCTFNAEPAVTLKVVVVNDARVEITYPNGVRVPYDAAASNNVQAWRSNHNPPVRYEFDSSRRLAWARVPAGNPAALSADEPFNPRIHRRAAVPGAQPTPRLQAVVTRMAGCEAVP